jgi:predicted nucleic acid-binding protein
VFANRFTVLLDANVLAPALTRNMLLSLAEAQFFRPRWSMRIMDETERTIAKLCQDHERPDAEADASRARSAMERAFEDATVTGFETIESGLVGRPDLRDPDDAHVIAAAIETSASIIVTDNLKDFPAAILASHGIEAKSANAFLADTIDLKPEKAAESLAVMRARFRNPVITAEDLLLKMEARGLGDAADLLRNHINTL